MSEQEQTQTTPTQEGAPSGDAPAEQPTQAAPAAPEQPGPSGGEPVGEGGDAGPVDLDAETAEERQARKLQGHQDDAERLRREHGQS